MEDAYKGAALTIAVGSARRIVISYASKPDARALGWLLPAQTAGKRNPYLFSQGESINNRSWLPTQDSPGIRQSWSASITVPADLVAVMSGERLTPAGEPAGAGTRRYRFRMDHNVPPYLIALAVGDLGFRPIDARTGVFTEPSQLDRDAAELSDTGYMVATAEGLYGRYRWAATTCWCCHRPSRSAVWGTRLSPSRRPRSSAATIQHRRYRARAGA